MQLQWLNKSVDLGGGLAQIKPVLQYRILETNHHDKSVQWSKWRDVPTVEED